MTKMQRGGIISSEFYGSRKLWENIRFHTLRKLGQS